MWHSRTVQILLCVAWLTVTPTQASRVICLDKNDPAAKDSNPGAQTMVKTFRSQPHTGVLNPLVNQGRQADLGWIDFYVDTDPSVDLSVELFADDQSSPYLTTSFTCDDDEGWDNAKTWKRVYVGEIAANRQILLSNSGISGRPRIHAIVPYFRPGGVI